MIHIREVENVQKLITAKEKAMTKVTSRCQNAKSIMLHVHPKITSLLTSMGFQVSGLEYLQYTPC